MSLVRMPARPKTKVLSGNQEKKKKGKKRPEWDDTVQNLDVHRATSEEIARRKEVHKSQNADALQMDKLRKRIAKARKSPMNSRKKQQQRQNALLREVLFNQSELSDTLAQSDQMMAVVHDLFGDQPGRYRGLPNVTAAPKKGKLRASDGSMIDNPTQLDLLSESVMDKLALNDLDATSSEYEEESDGEVDIPGYEPAIDMTRFRHFLKEAEKKAAQEAAAKKNKRSPVLHNLDGSYLEERCVTPDAAHSSQAINDTQKVKKTLSRIPSNKENSSSHSRDVATTSDGQAGSSIHSMDDLRKVMNGIEDNLAQYERCIGRQPTPLQRGDGFTGYTSALMNAVSRLTSYLKESEVRLKAESTLREQLSQDVSQTAAIVNSIASDVVNVQDQCVQIHTSFTRYKRDVDLQLNTIKNALTAHGIQIPAVRPQPLISSYPHLNTSVKPQYSLPNQVNMSSGATNAGYSHPNVSAQTAALPLSAPYQTNSPGSTRSQSTQHQPLPPHFQIAPNEPLVRPLQLHAQPPMMMQEQPMPTVPPSAFKAITPPESNPIDRRQLQLQIEEMDRQREAAELKLQQLAQLQQQQLHLQQRSHPELNKRTEAPPQPVQQPVSPAVSPIPKDPQENDKTTATLPSGISWSQTPSSALPATNKREITVQLPRASPDAPGAPGMTMPHHAADKSWLSLTSHIN